jgi:GDP-4-dehydro-6-deoxy-D-mannose reductase
MKAIVTGAGGFIGSHMVDFLLAKGFDVVGTTRPGGRRWNITHLLESATPLFTHADVDMRDRVAVENMIDTHRPDIIFHFAAQSRVLPSWEDPAYTINANVLGTVFIFEIIKRLKLPCKVIMACSSAAYGTTYENERPLKETNTLRPVHPYGISKMAAEWMAKQYQFNFGIDARVMRLFNQTGPRKIDDACSDFARAVAKVEVGKADPVIRVGNLDTYRDITGIKDTLAATWAVAERGKPGETYNVCSNQPTLIRDVLKKLVSFSYKKIKIVEKSEEKLRITDEPIILGDNTKIRSECGYKPKQALPDLFREMFDYWVEFYKKHDDNILT